MAKDTPLAFKYVSLHGLLSQRRPEDLFSENSIFRLSCTAPSLLVTVVPYLPRATWYFCIGPFLPLLWFSNALFLRTFQTGNLSVQMMDGLSSPPLISASRGILFPFLKSLHFKLAFFYILPGFAVPPLIQTASAHNAVLYNSPPSQPLIFLSRRGLRLPPASSLLFTQFFRTNKGIVVLPFARVLPGTISCPPRRRQGTNSGPLFQGVIFFPKAFSIPEKRERNGGLRISPLAY